eukprot:1779954-Prymnesium_polylepis.3
MSGPNVMWCSVLMTGGCLDRSKFLNGAFWNKPPYVKHRCSKAVWNVIRIVYTLASEDGTRASIIVSA